MEAKSLNLCMNKYVVHCVLINKMELFFFLFHNSGSLLLNIDFFCSKFKWARVNLYSVKKCIFYFIFLIWRSLRFSADFGCSNGQVSILLWGKRTDIRFKVPQSLGLQSQGNSAIHQQRIRVHQHQCTNDDLVSLSAGRIRPKNLYTLSEIASN